MSQSQIFMRRLSWNFITTFYYYLLLAEFKTKIVISLQIRMGIIHGLIESYRKLKDKQFFPKVKDEMLMILPFMNTHNIRRLNCSFNVKEDRR